MLGATMVVGWAEKVSFATRQGNHRRGAKVDSLVADANECVMRGRLGNPPNRHNRRYPALLLRPA